MAKRHVMLVLASAENNNNKFYEILLDEANQVQVRYGRVGQEGRREGKGAGEHCFERVLREKKAKGYKEVDVAVRDEGGRLRESLVQVAKRDLAAHNPELSALINRLAAVNRHQLMAATGGNITIEDGKVRTAVGLVTSSTVSAARETLVELKEYVSRQDTQSASYTRLLEQYLTLIPQKVPARRGWGPIFFLEHTTFERQHDLLEQLDASIEALEEEAASAARTQDQPELPRERIFSYTIDLMDDARVFRQIDSLYLANINRMHASSSLRLKRVYTLHNPDFSARYQQIAGKIGRERQLWHGTRAGNILSILKGGLIIPRSGAGYTITGRMFGDGLYFSDQSSKSLNYAYGYWDHGPRDHNCFMFLCDVAMGRSFVPKGPFRTPTPGYDSCFAKAGKSGVRNNEMIVYRLEQANLRYLCEFDK